MVLYVTDSEIMEPNHKKKQRNYWLLYDSRHP